MEDNIGFIYIAKNAAMPGLWKIGRSGKEDINKRMEDLYKPSGVPLPFEIVFAGKIENYEDVEKAIFDRFVKNRINPRREFFDLEPELIILWIKNTFPTIIDITENMNDERNKTIDHDYKKALENFQIKKSKTYEKRNSWQKKPKVDKKDTERKNRPRFSFKKLGIKIGETIISVDDNTKAKVINEHLVKCHGRESCSLNELTLEILNGKPSGSNLKHWEYNGKLLSEIYNKKYPKP